MALPGKNRAGKTTVFKIIAGLEGCDARKRMIRKGAVAGLLIQIPEFGEEYTVSDLLCSVFDDLPEIRIEMAELAELMAKTPFRS